MDEIERAILEKQGLDNITDDATKLIDERFSKLLKDLHEHCPISGDDCFRIWVCRQLAETQVVVKALHKMVHLMKPSRRYMCMHKKDVSNIPSTH